MQPEISVVISTYNREKSLAGTIESILAQEDAPAFELIVVDNRSTDGTREAIQAYEARAGRIVRYVFEGRQGVSYGRNAGIAAARASLIAFTDDDVVVADNWLAAMKNAFAERPECGCVGGKVLALWPEPPPAWLTERHWGPLALLDYGTAQALDANNRKCLITANMGIRREVLEQIGVFRPDFQKTAGSTCSVEDRELQERYWKAGGRCWFDPGVVVHAEIQPFRLRKEYHRRWHVSHGELHAILHDPEFERSGFRVFGVPGHVWRRFAAEIFHAAICALGFRREEAFEHELEARFFAGFIRKRYGQQQFFIRKGNGSVSKFLIGSVLAIAMSMAPMALAQTDTVRAAQQALKDKGFDPGPIDGIEGVKTREAISAYQKKQNLTSNGMLSPETLDSLGVKKGTAGTKFNAAGSNVKNSFGSGGKEVGEGGKALGSDLKHGEVLNGAKTFGKDLGHGVAKMGKGTGQATENAAKGVKHAVSHDKDANENQ
jgi:glycosyltransferase involved in cell wall biosynthesis